MKAFFKPERIQAAGSDEAIKASLEALLLQHLEAEPEAGSVAFVGAGPGDPELLTLKARRHIHEAEVIIYDRLVGKGVLELARREAKFIDVGKKGFGAQVTQDKINEYLVREALAGWKVVRLKGGDPSVFGRLTRSSQRSLKPALIARLFPVLRQLPRVQPVLSSRSRVAIETRASPL